MKINELINSTFLTLGFLFVGGGFILLLGIFLNIISIDIYRITILFFFGSLFLGFYWYRKIDNYYVFWIILSLLFVYIGYTEPIFNIYKINEFSYLFQIGIVLLMILSTNSMRERSGMDIALFSLDALYVISIFSTFIMILLWSNDIQITSSSIFFFIINRLPIWATTLLDVNLNYTIKIIENVLSGIISLGYVSRRRQKMPELIEERGVSKYAVISCIILGLFLIILPTWTFITNKTSPLSSIIMGCFGFIFMYPNVKYVRDREL